jgi:hypothetical protein
MELTQALINNGSAQTLQEAQSLVNDMRRAVEAGDNPEHVLNDFELEPDYVVDLI